MSHSNSIRSSENVLYLSRRAPATRKASLAPALRERLLQVATGVGLALALAAVALAAPTPAVAHGLDAPAAQVGQQ